MAEKVTTPKSDVVYLPRPSPLWMRSGFVPAVIATLGFLAVVADHFWPQLPWTKWTVGFGSLLGVWAKLLYDHKTKPSTRYWVAEKKVREAAKAQSTARVAVHTEEVVE